MQEVRQKEVVIMEKLTKNAKSKTSKYSSRAFNLILTVSPLNNAVNVIKYRLIISIIIQDFQTQ